MHSVLCDTSAALLIDPTDEFVQVVLREYLMNATELARSAKQDATTLEQDIITALDKLCHISVEQTQAGGYGYYAPHISQFDDVGLSLSVFVVIPVIFQSYCTRLNDLKQSIFTSIRPQHSGSSSNAARSGAGNVSFQVRKSALSFLELLHPLVCANLHMCDVKAQPAMHLETIKALLQIVQQHRMAVGDETVRSKALEVLTAYMDHLMPFLREGTASQNAIPSRKAHLSSLPKDQAMLIMVLLDYSVHEAAFSSVLSSLQSLAQVDFTIIEPHLALILENLVQISVSVVS